MTPNPDHFVIVGERTIPVVAFFGTKGGVGKTTIVNKFSSLVSRATSAPNVLLVDFDVHHRGLTVLRTKDNFGACRTIHEYLADNQLSFQGAQDVTVNPGEAGREYLIPSSNLAAARVFSTLTKLKPVDLVQRLSTLLTAAANAYQIDLIIVDCGPIVDPLTASAAFMSDMGFIIGQNEPITFQSLQNYALRIRDFLPQFDASKIRVILNKVRGAIAQDASIYAAIPFTMEVVDYSEGLSNVDEIRLMYLDYCVYSIIASVFRGQYKPLIPGVDAVLSTDQKTIIDLVDRYVTSRWYGRLRRSGLWLFIGCAFLLIAGCAEGARLWLVRSDVTVMLGYGALALGACGATVGGLGYWLYRRKQLADGIIRLREKSGYEGFLALLTTRDGRQKFNEIEVMSNRTSKEQANEPKVASA